MDVPPTSIAGNTSGLGGGLRELDRRASWCRNGMGENMGVVGAETILIVLNAVVAVLVSSSSSSVVKASHVDVTSNVFSTARRYLPM